MFLRYNMSKNNYGLSLAQSMMEFLYQSISSVVFLSLAQSRRKNKYECNLILRKFSCLVNKIDYKSITDVEC